MYIYSVWTEYWHPFDAVTNTLSPLSMKIFAFPDQLMEEKLNFVANLWFSKNTNTKLVFAFLKATVP